MSKKHLIVVGHPDTDSFCYNGIYKTIKEQLESNGEEYITIDLYRDSFKRPRTDLIESYQKVSNLEVNSHLFCITCLVV